MNYGKVRCHPRRLHFEQYEARLCLSAFTFESHDIITDAITDPISVFAADLDGDGDSDFVVSTYAGEIRWYENTDGRGTFGQRQLIATADYLPRALLAADLDGDDDLDVIYTLQDDDHCCGGFAWHENLDGWGSFGPQKRIKGTGRAWSLAVADMDSDGDLDVLLAASSISNIAWYENMGKGSFGTERLITDEVQAPLSVATGDIDGDGDLDVLSGSCFGEIAWYENWDGKGSLDPVQFIYNQDCIFATAAEDVDGDGDLDLLFASPSKIAWHENTDGLGNFGAEQVITTDGALFMSVVDLDGDGDMDILTPHKFSDIIVSYENSNGAGNFETHILASRIKEPWSLAIADVDGDGDLDVLSASYDDGRIAWYEQRLVGDANDDGIFNSSDLVKVFQAGKYDDAGPLGATFDEGDWNGDGKFNSSDLVLAFQAGTYAAVSLPAPRELPLTIGFALSRDDAVLRSRSAMLQRNLEQERKLELENQ